MIDDFLTLPGGRRILRTAGAGVGVIAGLAAWLIWYAYRAGRARANNDWLAAAALDLRSQIGAELPHRGPGDH